MKNSLRAIKALIFVAISIICFCMFTSCEPDDTETKCDCKTAVYFNERTGQYKTYENEPFYCKEGVATVHDTVKDYGFIFVECKNKPSY